MSRLVSAGSLVFDQVDIFVPNQPAVRLEGLSSTAVETTAFINNTALPWPLSDGMGVPDTSVASGAVYFNEILGSSGFYSLRFFPDRVGFWKIVVRVPSFPLEIVREYEVAPAGLFESPAKGTLIASTTK